MLGLKRSNIGFNDELLDSTDLNSSKISKAGMCNQPEPSLFEFTSVRKSIVSQSEFDQLILNLIVNATLPFSLVEQNNFKLLCQKGFPSRTLLSRPTLMCRLNAAFDHLICNLITDMSSVKYLTTTADCWSIFKRSYIGITCHWIDEENLSRKSVLLTIKRLDGRHAFDVLVGAMESVYLKFEILNKISFTTTDNGSNFVKSFKMYGCKPIIEVENDVQDPGLNESEYDIYGEENKDDEDNIDEIYSSIIPITEIIKNNVDDFNYNLPAHHRCAAHTLNLVATKDIENALNKPGIHGEHLLYKKQSRLTMAKCMAVWNKQSRSTCMADIIHKCLDVYLKCPNDKRWNSMFDSIKFMLLQIKRSPSKFLRMCDELNVVRLTKSDIEWLEEYVIVMEPLAVCLNILQGEKFMYFGYLIPFISQLISQYENMKINKNFKFCRSLVDIICFNVKKRFETQLTGSFLITAAISHPFFKTNWIKNDVKREIAINQFKNAVNEFSQSSNVEDDSTPEISSNKNQ